MIASETSQLLTPTSESPRGSYTTNGPAPRSLPTTSSKGSTPGTTPGRNKLAPRRQIANGAGRAGTKRGNVVSSPSARTATTRAMKTGSANAPTPTAKRTTSASYQKTTTTPLADAAP